MSLTETHESLAFGPGSDLWILPERKTSELVRRLDWYLNFQIAKAAVHQPREISPSLKTIIQQCELETFDSKNTDQDSLLILSFALFPNRWMMLLRGSENLNQWAEKAVQKWQQLKSPTVRIFLPQNATATQFEKLWKKFGGSESITVVAEQDEESHG